LRASSKLGSDRIGQSDAGATPYDAAYYEAREGWRDRHVESLAAAASVGAIPGGVIIDVGCGTGPLLPLLRRRHLLPVGVDTNLMALTVANRRRCGSVLRMSPRPDLPFLSACAGAIVAQHLIEHVDDAALVLQEWRRVLLPGGRLVLLTPNAQHPDQAIFHDPQHRVLFSAGSITRLLRSAGFETVAVQGLFPYLGAGRLGRALSRRAWQLGRLRPWTRRARTLLVTARRHS